MRACVSKEAGAPGAYEGAGAAIGLADLFGFFEDFAYLCRPFPVWLNKCLRDGERQQGVI